MPTSKSTTSYWHREPSEKLLGHRSTPELPVEADVVIVGSGITGAFAARELVKGGRNVLVLEAREACWGATGRNGGHCQPFVYSSWPHIARFELDTFTFLHDLVKENNIPCDWRTVGGVHRIETPELADLVARHLANLQRRHPDLADKVRLVTDKTELEALRVTNAAAAVIQPFAARLWPYKLVAWVLEQLLREGPLRFNLQTTTPVTHLQRVSGSSQQSGDHASWIVHTDRGQVAARHVVLATNGYTSHLLPAMTRLVVPVRGQVCALRPPPPSRPLDHSYVWVSNLSDNYLIQAADDADGQVLILGGERSGAPGGDVGVSRDDEVVPEVGRRLRHALHDALRLMPSKGASPAETAQEPDAVPASHEWTGIMGYTPDEHPWVGPVTAALLSGKERDADADKDVGVQGLWICAGYTGHGMPRAALCAVAVADMILGREPTVKLPDEFRVSDERIEAGMKVERVGSDYGIHAMLETVLNKDL